MDIFKLIGGLSASRLRNTRDDDTQADRLSHRYTTTLCCIFAIIVSTKQYVGDPIDCWAPAQFKTSYERYADSYCWMKNTYSVPMHEDIPNDEDIRKSQEIRYYQWVPFILSLQAFFFYFPRILWRTGNSRYGINIVSLVDAAQKYEKFENFELRDKIMLFMANSIERRARATCVIVHLYLLVKLLWFTNLLVQVAILNALFGNPIQPYGFELIMEFFKLKNTTESRYFPKVTYCDFVVREVGFAHHYTVQCVLKINLFNEVIFTFLWFWMLMILTITTFDLFNWLCRLTLRSDLRYIRSHLSDRCDDESTRRFSTRFLNKDVIFCLQLLEANSCDLTVTELISELWKKYTDSANDVQSNYKIAPIVSSGASKYQLSPDGQGATGNGINSNHSVVHHGDFRPSSNASMKTQDRQTNQNAHLPV
ncbi:hypothetical protein ACOME3_008922 [Neoechinorhynchus agilis]